MWIYTSPLCIALICIALILGLIFMLFWLLICKSSVDKVFAELKKLEDEAKLATTVEGGTPDFPRQGLEIFLPKDENPTLNVLNINIERQGGKEEGQSHSWNINVSPDNKMVKLSISVSDDGLVQVISDNCTCEFSI